MKKNRFKLLQLLMINIFLLIMLVTVNLSYGYQIEITAIPKDNLTNLDNKDDFPELVYRKETAAYKTTIENYNNRVYPVSSISGWVYAKDLVGREDLNVKENDFIINDAEHKSAYSFERYYDFFHKDINSLYAHTQDGNETYEVDKYAKYYLTGSLQPSYDGVPSLSKGLSYNVLYYVWSESDDYSGLYNQKATQSVPSEFKTDFQSSTDIEIYSSTLYRFAVLNTVYVSDNYLTNDTVKHIKEKFKDCKVPGTNEGEIYQSSVLRTSSANDKGTGYYKNMDTAFKFWESTIRGQYPDLQRAWSESTSISGKKSGTQNGETSVINYYDNIFKFPLEDNQNRKIYVRHIDVTDLDTINSGTILNTNVITTTNVSAIKHDRSSWLTSIGNLDPSRNGIETDGYKYSEIYDDVSSEYDLRIGNIKYSYSENGVVKFSSIPTDKTISPEEATIITDYNCIGAVIGKGETLEAATSSRDGILNNIDIRTASDSSSESGSIVKNVDSTSVVVAGSSIEPVVVIDIYYEKKPTEVYVRHIDVTDSKKVTNSSKTIQTGVGQAFLSYSKMPDNLIKTMLPTNRDYKPTGSSTKYQEFYKTTLGHNVLRVANIKYDHETAGSYWNLLTEKQKETYENYICIGAAVGKGDSITVAENKKSNALKTINNSRENLINYTNSSQTSSDSYIVTNENWLSEIVTNEYNVVVVDFYYMKGKTTDILTSSKYKYVYVRHIDITGIDDINSSSIDKATRLKGKGKALKNDSSWIDKLTDMYVGYQEVYKIKTNETLEVFKDPDDNYICVGSNVTSSGTSANDAKGKLDSKLNNRIKYDTWPYIYNSKSLVDSRIVDNNNGSAAILIDFYYTSKNTGTLIEREKIGRLSFYTTDGSSEFKDKVDNHTNSNKATVYDVIPSGSTLRMSIDNAYTYMLGGINVVEQTKEGTYEFEYTLTQKYKVTYNDWYSVCDDCGYTKSKVSSKR